LFNLGKERKKTREHDYRIGIGSCNIFSM